MLSRTTAPLPYQPPRGSQHARRLVLVAVIGAWLGLLALVFDRMRGPQGLTDLGWLTLLLAVVLAGLLVAHHRYGVGQLVRAAGEYTVVALLVGLIITAAANPQGQPHKAKPKPAAKQPAQTVTIGAGCPELRRPVAWLQCVANQAGKPRPHSPTGQLGGHK